MSTRLLSTPGKAHELRDDLESLWFVFLYEALHFVKHNKPFEIRMHLLFDQADVCHITGTHTGGVGKTVFYFSGGAMINRRLDFGNKPFNTLVRQIYQLFQSLNAYYTEQDIKVDPEVEDLNSPLINCVRKLDSCTELERLLREALDAKGWPESCDKVEDQYPPTTNLTPEQKNTIAISYVNSPARDSGEPFGTKRKREESEGSPPASESKRIKVNPVWKQIWSKCVGLVRR